MVKDLRVKLPFPGNGSSTSTFLTVRLAVRLRHARPEDHPRAALARRRSGAARRCGSSGRDGGAPVACREGKATILDALRAAPDEVVIGGEAPLSDCIVPGAEEGELADLGEAALAAANQLNAEARSGSAKTAKRAALELGYLVGAIARGEEATEGVHNELLRRLTVSAKFVPQGESLPPSFKRAYATGYVHGRRAG